MRLSTKLHSSAACYHSWDMLPETPRSMICVVKGLEPPSPQRFAYSGQYATASHYGSVHATISPDSFYYLDLSLGNGFSRVHIAFNRLSIGRKRVPFSMHWNAYAREVSPRTSPRPSGYRAGRCQGGKHRREPSSPVKRTDRVMKQASMHHGTALDGEHAVDL
jgi:hypothetical protein